MDFALHPSLANKAHVIDLPLCKILLQQNVFYPWIILVPKRANVSRMMDLSLNDQLTLMQEMDLAQKILWELFNPTQLNVAALGNKTPQLHIHVIARYADDPAWPNTVWDYPNSSPNSTKKTEEILHLLKKSFALKK